jgi:phosphonate transport system permease protein
MLYLQLALFQQAQAATVLLAMFALVLIVDSISAHVRRGLTPAYA